MRLYLFPLMLQLIGVIVVMAEIFIPSFGLLSLIALGVFAYSLYLVFSTISVTAGMVVAGIDIVAIPVFIYMGIRVLARSKLSLKSELAASEGVAAQSENLVTVLDKTGTAVTDLRPAGMAMIGGQRLDVVTDGEYIDAGTPVVVVRVTGNQVIVEKNANKETIQ